MERVKANLDEIESKIASFKEAHITELPELLNMNLQTLSNIERSIERVHERLSGLREKEQYLKVQLASIPPYVDGEEVSKQRRLDQLKVELVNLTNRYSEEYPDVKKIRAEIGELEKQLSETNSSPGTNNKPPDNTPYITLSAQLASTRADIGAVTGQLDELLLDANEYRRRIEAIPKVEETYQAMLGERANIRAKYEDLMRKHMEARLAHGLEKEQKGERFTLIEPARMPGKPHKPNRKAIMLIGLVLGLGAAVGFAALREFTDDTIRSADSLVDATKFPVLAGIPIIMTRKDIARRRVKRIAWVAGTVGTIVGGAAAFHFLVMDWYIFWTKLMRKLAI
jgi:chromosome segregation ATPase